ncbi:unnamed protein product [Clavelina lepadiformis]|uniref:Uncharacterized protein n=1 Tax=Clavelina lepadiformis TaxID=159417 RepID=A0ABP0GJ46_CLALP
MERDLGTMQVDAALKTSCHVNAILQEFKSMRQDMKMEFAKVQENMEDMASKVLAETKKVEIMNNAMQFEETSQPSVADSETKKAGTMKNAIPTKETSQVSVVESDFGVCIDGV